MPGYREFRNGRYNLFEQWSSSTEYVRQDPNIKSELHLDLGESLYTTLPAGHGSLWLVQETQNL